MSSPTAAMAHSQDDDRPAHYTFEDEQDDDDDDESSAEDVFAFLPPSTADAPPLHQYPPLEYPAPVYNPATPVRVSLPSTVEKDNVRDESFAQTASEEGSIKSVSHNSFFIRGQCLFQDGVRL
jgi:hypothetical protein